MNAVRDPQTTYVINFTLFAEHTGFEPVTSDRQSVSLPLSLMLHSLLGEQDSNPHHGNPKAIRKVAAWFFVKNRVKYVCYHYTIPHYKEKQDTLFSGIQITSLMLFEIAVCIFAADKGNRTPESPRQQEPTSRRQLTNNRELN